MAQRSDEWFARRCGKFTGSRFEDVMAVSKSNGKPLKARNDLIWSIVAERIQGYQPQGPKSYSLDWGIANETFAREAYELRTGNMVHDIDFIDHPVLDYAGASPDGLVYEDGMVEIKCPKSPEVHLQRWIDGVPEEYKAQIQGQLWVTGRKWCDFISYDADTAPEFQLLIIRVLPDAEYIEKLETEVVKANIEVNIIINQLYERVINVTD